MSAPRPARLRPVRELGRGGMGAVELVWDAVREENVARKRATRASATEAARTKREFRIAAELDHPSLVRVIELGEDAEGPWFTMEALDAVDLRVACRGQETVVPSRSTVRSADAETTLDESAPTVGALTSARPIRQMAEHDMATVLARVARYLPPLLEGLGHLHARGLVHRDLKPANVLVTSEGRVVLVDYGILAEVARPPGEVVGTAAYMAPEQLRGAPPNPATDRYALGVTLHELLSGELPFSASGLALVVAHLEEPPRELGSDVPLALRTVVRQLLAKDPVARPSLAEVGRVLAEALAAREAVLPGPALDDGSLVGRHAMQQRLDAARPAPGSRFRLCALEGPTGAGKSALMRWLIERHVAAGGLAIVGRARGSELLPFNAVDAAIADLSRLLTPHERASRACQLAASVFPVLSPGAPALEVPRASALAALAVLASSVASRGGLLWCIDDLQWADDDSLALLDALARARPEGVLLLCTLRNDVEPSEATRWLAQIDTVDRDAVPPLDVAASRTLIERVLSAERATLDPRVVDELASQCEGRAFFAEAAGRLAARRSGPITHGIEQMLADEVASLGAPSRRALASLHAAGGWASLGDVAAHAAERIGETDRLVDALVRAGLVRRSGARDERERLDLFHDVVRAVVGGALLPDELRAAHASHAARCTETVPKIRHLLGAGETETAAALAVTAAKEARDRRAYALEASLHEIAAQHGAPGDRPAARRARAEALEMSGAYAQAAQAWRAVADDEPLGDRRADAVFHEAHALLASGDDVAGRTTLDASLELRGERRLAAGWLGKTLAGLRFVAGPARVGAASATSSLLTSGHDVEVALMLAWKEPLASIDFVQRRRSAARHPADGAWCDALLAYLSFAATRERSDEGRARRFEAAARARLALRADPEALAMLHGAASLAAMRAGRWDASVASGLEAARIVEDLGRVRSHTHIAYLLNATGGLIWGERPQEAARSLDGLASRIHEGETAIRLHIRVIRVGLTTMLGQFGQARAIADEIAAEHQQPVTTFAALIDGMMAAFADVHTGEPRRSHERVQALLDGAAPMRPMQGMYGGAFASFAALVAANALRAGVDVPMALFEQYEKLARTAVPFGHTGAIRAMAYARDAARDGVECLSLLSRAEAEAIRWGHPISAAIARYQRGIRVGGDDGDELIRRAEAELITVGADRRILDEDFGRR